MKRFIIALYILAGTIAIYAQEGQTQYNFLRLPVSARAAALGGANITINTDDENLVFENPALLTNVSNHTLCFTYNNYLRGINALSAAFNKTITERASVAISARYLDYGHIKQTDEYNIEHGEFIARDMALAAHFAYKLGKNIKGGISTRLISSVIGQYNSVAVGVDLGLNYTNSDDTWSMSVVANNLGGQIKAFDDEYAKMPINLSCGVTRRLPHTPFRFSAQMSDLTQWNYKFINHLSAGVEVIISKAIWLGAGYNFRRANEMKIADSEGESNHGAGITFGGGINLSKLKLNVAYARNHLASSSLTIDLAYTL